MMLCCREASRLISRSMEERLGLKDAVALRFHTGMCGACRLYQRQVRQLRELVRRGLQAIEAEGALPGVDLSREEWEQLAEAVAAAVTES